MAKISNAKVIAVVEQTYGDWQPPITPLPNLNLPTITPQPFTKIEGQFFRLQYSVIPFTPVRRQSDGSPT